MALLCFNSFTLAPLPLLHSSSSSSSSIFHVPTTPISRLHVGLPQKSLNGVRISTPFVAQRRKNALIVAAADSGGAEGGATSQEGGESEKKESVGVPVDKLPLESKLKEREEQRLRMKLAKKIRLRRKRLLRKRKLRKKGRWPPSKMKKLKNV